MGRDGGSEGGKEGAEQEGGRDKTAMRWTIKTERERRRERGGGGGGREL